jgi:predicted secreted protein
VIADPNMTAMDLKIAAGLHYVVLFSAFAVLWFLCLFCLLPLGLGAERDPDTGAPLRPMLGKKALWAAGIAAVLWLGFYGAVALRWLEI